MVKASLVIPDSSVDNERFFSKMNYIKTLLSNKISVLNMFARLKILHIKILEEYFNFKNLWRFSVRQKEDAIAAKKCLKS